MVWGIARASLTLSSCHTAYWTPLPIRLLTTLLDILPTALLSVLILSEDQSGIGHAALGLLMSL